MLRDGLSPEGQAELDAVLDETAVEEHVLTPEQTAALMLDWGGEVA